MIMRTNDVCYQGHFKCAERAGAAAGRYSIPYCTEGGTVGFFCSFLLEGIIFPQVPPLNQLPGESRQTHFIILNIQ